MLRVSQEKSSWQKSVESPNLALYVYLIDLIWTLQKQKVISVNICFA